ncbi:RtcB family protein, partial [Candidatus Sumerlaeota bacterium]|nr:RtcB family protein [Candidatus Sumerlaeota bacterium]
MADAHVGLGATIGSVFGTIDAVIPSAVGVDIGCGMCAMPTDNDWQEIKPHAQDLLNMLTNAIFHAIPLGMDAYKTPQPWRAEGSHRGFDYESRYSQLNREIQKEAPLKLATLGGGNHFIELQKDQDDRLWLMIHSGSRHAGKEIADFYIRLARQVSQQMGAGVPRDLSYLPTSADEGRSYLDDMTWALNYAYENRLQMMDRVLTIFKQVMGRFGLQLRYDPSDLVNIHHNYAALEEHFGRKVWMHRKGATLATRDLKGIIPGSMGSKSYIVVGKGNADAFQSCSHGAGRRMSRTEAFRKITKADLKEAIGGILLRHASDVRDEAPQAYKNIDEVMAAQSDLVDIVVTLTPLAVIKG